MWLPMWRAAPIEVAKPSQERRRRPVMTWLWVGMLVALAAAIAAGAFEIGASRRRAGR